MFERKLYRSDMIACALSAKYNVLKTRNKERILSLLTLTGEFLILVSLLCGIYRTPELTGQDLHV